MADDDDFDDDDADFDDDDADFGDDDDADFGDDNDGFDDNDGGDKWSDGDGDFDGNDGFGDDDQREPWQIDVENLYYTAESEIKNDPQSALSNFLKCVKLEEEKGGSTVDKRFNALKFIVELYFNMGANSKNDMVEQYKKLLSYADNDGVSPNDLNSAIRSILNKTDKDADAAEEMYSLTLDYFRNKSGKQSVWFEFAMRLCNTYLSAKSMKKCELLLDQLHKSCKDPSTGQDDAKNKGSQLLEIYAIKIQLMAAANNRVALNELFLRTNQLCADVNDPRSMSVIKECWGKMYSSMNQWNEAYRNFFDAFRSYQDIGHSNVKQCLKYVIISSMLCEQNTNPFASQEAGVFKTNNDIMGIAALLESFDDDDIRRFEKTLNRNAHTILNDPWIKEHMPAVKLKIRSKVLVKLIKPYTRVKLSWLCQQLNATPGEIENLVVNLILDGSINGRLDQIHSLLDLNYSTPTDKLYGAMDSWLNAVNKLRNNIATRTGRQNFGGGRGMGMHAFGGGMMDFDMMDDDFYGHQFGMGDNDFMSWIG